MAGQADEWLPLSRSSFRQRLALSAVAIVPFAFLANALGPIATALFPGLDQVAAALAVYAILVAGVVASIAIHAAAHPNPYANFVRRQVRVGRYLLPFAEIDSAVLRPLGSPAKPGLLLQFGRYRGQHAAVLFRTNRGELLAPEYRERLIEVFAASRVRLPSSPYDPDNRFARYNFPGHLDRKTLIELLSHPPLPGEPLPVILA
jgi:hypothetical protein